MTKFSLKELEFTFFVLDSGNQKAIDGWILLSGWKPPKSIDDFFYEYYPLAWTGRKK